jgi:hypothetical protein
MERTQIINKYGVMFSNHGKYDFIDISSEIYREYTFSDGFKLKIEDVLYLAVSDSGHRLFDQHGVSHFIPYGWRHLTWKVKDGHPNFVK